MNAHVRDNENSLLAQARHVRIHFEAAASVDAHGTLGAGPHYHFADGSTTTISSRHQVPLPGELIGTASFVFWASSTVGGGNWRLDISVHEYADGGTSPNTLLSGAATYAAPAAANTMLKRTVALSSQPTAGRIFGQSAFARIGADAADTNTGQMSLWAAYLEFA